MLAIAKTIAASLREDELDLLLTFRDQSPEPSLQKCKTVQSLLNLRILETRSQSQSVKLTEFGRLVAVEIQHHTRPAPPSNLQKSVVEKVN